MHTRAAVAALASNFLSVDELLDLAAHVYERDEPLPAGTPSTENPFLHRAERAHQNNRRHA